jgi:hypothetical protein
MAGSNDYLIPSLSIEPSNNTHLPTALEWKSGTVRFGGLIHLVSSEEWLSTLYHKSGVLVILTPMYGWLK